MKRLVSTLTVFLGFVAYSFGASINSVVSALNRGDVRLAQELARELPADERIKLEVIVHLMEGRQKEAKNLFSLIKSRNRVYPFNILYRENGGNIIIVSKSRQELKIYRFNSDYPSEVRKFTVTTGANAGDKWYRGDKKTPNGVYYPVSYRTNLPLVYGSGAFPLNYPNVLDKYKFKKTGGGIWLHSSNRNYYLSKYSSRGCVITTDPDFRKIKKYVSLKNTPVVIVPDYEMVDRRTYFKYRERLLNFFRDWKANFHKALRGDKFDLYFMYSSDFVSKEGTRFQYLDKVLDDFDSDYTFSTDDLTILKYARIPFWGDIFVISFIFNYGDDFENHRVRKILYIKEFPEGLKIIGEENIKIR